MSDQTSWSWPSRTENLTSTPAATRASTVPRAAVSGTFMSSRPWITCRGRPRSGGVGDRLEAPLLGVRECRCVEAGQDGDAGERRGPVAGQAIRRLAAHAQPAQRDPLGIHAIARERLVERAIQVGRRECGHAGGEQGRHDDGIERPSARDEPERAVLGDDVSVLSTVARAVEERISGQLREGSTS